MSSRRHHFPRRPVANSSAIVGGSDSENKQSVPYRFTIITDGLLRFEYSPSCEFEDRASVLAINREQPVPNFRVVNKSSSLEIITKSFHLRYDKRPFSASGLAVRVIGNVTDWHSRWRYQDTHSEHQLGGTARTLDEVDGRCPLGPGVINNHGYSEIDDSGTPVFDEHGWIKGRLGKEEGFVDGYLFAYGTDFRGAIKAFYALSGSQPLIPRWALGNWWSRYYRYTDKEYLELMDQFNDEDVPLSVAVIDMDWHWTIDERVKESGQSGWTGYSWDTGCFPKPKEFLAELRKRGLRSTLNEHPADGVARYEDVYEKMCKALGQDPANGDPVLFDITEPKFNDAYFDILLKHIEDDGVDFWWVDWQQGPYSTIPGVDPLWALNHFHFLNSKRDGRLPLTFSRFAGPGSHRYPVGFSGDTIVTWESLHFQPEFTATSSNIGYGWWSHDIGGHTDGYRDDELAARWVQYGLFSPILRLHSTANPWNSKEPWRFIPEAKEAMITALQLRHHFLPYLYSMNVRCAREDEPLVQPIYWHHGGSEAFMNKNTYYFGSELFVAPLTTPRDKVTRRAKVKTWFPPGRFVDIFSGVVYDGDRTMWLYRTLEEYAVFAKEGSIIPMNAENELETGCANPKDLLLRVVVGADAKFTLYEDDGKQNDEGEVAGVETVIEFKQSTGMLTIAPASGNVSAIPSTRSWQFTFIGADVEAEHEGKSLTKSLGQSGVSYHISNIDVNKEIQIKLPKDPQLRKNDPPQLAFKILDEAQMDYNLKKTIWASLSSDKPLSSRFNELQTLGMDAELLGAFSEVLFADSRV